MPPRRSTWNVRNHEYEECRTVDGQRQLGLLLFYITGRLEHRLNYIAHNIHEGTVRQSRQKYKPISQFQYQCWVKGIIDAREEVQYWDPTGLSFKLDQVYLRE
ncbi:hypothetical protein CPB84DRAFT_1752164 [Gymnopilus junonius]|uniref:Uncharacterized protein n=1 Tax=Gymnopilus junonius TaxID=109634 RepID=A0A9P5NCZ5_GYMJU|nr:hypothetical protein CPB84DRAFT_1752164 [Gymnopilus junonius]